MEKGGLYLYKMIFNFFIYNKFYDLYYPIILKSKGNKIEIDGLVIHLNPDDNAVSQGIFRGNYEIEEIKSFKKMLCLGSTVIDIGANIGYYSLIASKQIGEKGIVYAFEPVPENYELLLKNIKVNNLKNIVPINKAVSKENSTIQIFLDKHNKGAHSIGRDNTEYSGVCVNVKTIRLDDFLKENKIKKVDIIKIDTQGCEAFIFEGMQNLIKKSVNLKILSEFWPQGLKKCGSDPEEFLNKLKKDFDISIIGNKKGNIDEISKTEDKQEYVDLLLVSKKLIKSKS